MCNVKKYFLALLVLLYGNASPHSFDTTLTGTIASRVITYTPTIGLYERATGFIEFANGFTCTTDPAYLYDGPHIGVNAPVSGTIDLSHGAMFLTDDLHIASVTIAGGYITPWISLQPYGCIMLNNHTLYMDSDLTLTSDYLIFQAPGVIDGQGHSIYLNGGALAFMPFGVIFPNPNTITLRNLVIHNAQNTLGDPIYQVISYNLTVLVILFLIM